ncbi:phosphoribosylglycinamide formyltransferase [Aliikangiella sp. IMCC44632]
MARKRIVILISGNGSNLQALINAQSKNFFDADIVAVISNNPAAHGLVRAQNAGIATAILPHQDYSSRELFDQSLAAEIQKYKPDLIVLAGFMRILSEAFVSQFYAKLINIHPSLLPKYPGLNTHAKALKNQDEFHGSSVHYVTKELDGGPVIAQAKVKLMPNDTELSLAERVLTQEHRLFPQVVKWIIEEKVTMLNNQAYWEKKVLTHPIQLD